MSVKKYRVEGMTCDHCAMSVREEIDEVAGASVVDVDVPGGTVTVSGEGFTDDAIAAAVQEAGFKVVD